MFYSFSTLTTKLGLICIRFREGWHVTTGEKVVFYNVIMDKNNPISDHHTHKFTLCHSICNSLIFIPVTLKTCFSFSETSTDQGYRLSITYSNLNPFSFHSLHYSSWSIGPWREGSRNIPSLNINDISLDYSPYSNDT